MDSQTLPTKRPPRRHTGAFIALAVFVVLAGAVWLIRARNTAGTKIENGQMTTRQFSVAVPTGASNQASRNDGDILLKIPTSYGQLKVNIFTTDVAMTTLSRLGTITTAAVTISGVSSPCQTADLSNDIRGTYRQPQIRYSITCEAIPLPSKSNHTEIIIDALSTRDLTADERASVNTFAAGIFQSLKIKTGLALWF